MKDYIAIMTSREALCRDLRRIMDAIDDHDCADPRAIEWRCDQVGRFGTQLYASWPCNAATEQGPRI